MGTITQLTLASIKPTGSVQFIRDERLRGFGIKVTAKGKASYIVEARLKGGKPVRHTIGNVEHISLDEARTQARGLLYRLKQGENINLVPKTPEEPDTLAAVFQAYVRDRVGLRDSTKNDYKKIMGRCFSDWGDRPIDSITQSDVAERYQALRSETSDNYAKKAMRTLRAVLNSGDITTNPVSQFFRRSGTSSLPSARIRYLSGHEIARIIEYTRDPSTLEWNPFGELLFFYLLTGCRRNEALRLKKQDYSDGTLTFRDTKNRRDHIIPTEGLLQGIVDRRIEQTDSDYLWAYTDSSFRTQLAEAKRALDFDTNWTVHDLRRTFAEHAQLIGVDHHIISACLNHSPVGVTATSYLGGGLAKREMLRDVYSRLQRQYMLYAEGQPEVRYPDGMTIEELTNPVDN